MQNAVCVTAIFLAGLFDSYVDIAGDDRAKNKADYG
jgi:hypothetical protein